MDRKKKILTTSFFLLVAALYLYIYRDAFVRQPIRITHTLRLRAVMARSRPNGASRSFPLIPTFTLGKDYRLTSVKVIRLDELQAKGFAHPLWELVADSTSSPTSVFMYGFAIEGMHTKVADAEPVPLVTNVTYRVLVTAGRYKGQHDFTITGRDLPADEAAPAAAAD
jgi:hypothetical protein